jgi:hypothetical protein
MQTYVDVVCAPDSATRVLAAAPLWEDAALMSLTFRGEDERSVNNTSGSVYRRRPSENVFLLEDVMRGALAVAEVEMDASDGSGDVVRVLGIGKKSDARDAITLTERLVTKPGGAGYVRVPATGTFPLSEVVAWSEAFVRTLGLTTTQVAVMASLAPKPATDALLHILSMKTGVINSLNIDLMAQDAKQEIMYKLAAAYRSRYGYALPPAPETNDSCDGAADA